MKVIGEYIITQAALKCPQCSLVFSSEAIKAGPEVTPDATIESDLHWVLPDASIRASILGLCPKCNYCWWQNAFEGQTNILKSLPDSPDVSPAQKFAKAVLTGRSGDWPVKYQANIALNGYWCAKESGEDVELWLELVKKELEKALSDSEWQGNRGYYHYLLGELCRLSKNFVEAMANYNKVDTESHISLKLLDQQRSLAVVGDSSVEVLSAEFVKEMFCFENDIDKYKSKFEHADVMFSLWLPTKEIVLEDEQFAQEDNLSI